jgi:mercuric ion transport protein
MRNGEKFVGHADEHAGLSSVPDEGSRKTWVAAGGILGAVAASSCCILPLGLFSLGVGGAWIGNLTALAPYQPIFVVITLGFLGYGYWLVYRKPKTDCKDTSVCTSSSAGRTVRIALWSATALVAAAAAFPYVGPLLLGV